MDFGSSLMPTYIVAAPATSLDSERAALDGVREALNAQDQALADAKLATAHLRDTHFCVTDSFLEDFETRTGALPRGVLLGAAPMIRC